MTAILITHPTPDAAAPLHDWITYYAANGLRPIPVKQNKSPFAKGWQRGAVGAQWEYALSVDPSPGIGLTAHGEHNLFFVDCEDRPTLDATFAHFAAHGLDATRWPLVQSASGLGFHLYGLTDGTPGIEAVGHHRLLHPSIGEGHVKYGYGSYVCAPPTCATSSRRPDGGVGEYTFVNDLECLNDAPQVPFALVADLAKKSPLTTRPVTIRPPIADSTPEPQDDDTDDEESEDAALPPLSPDELMVAEHLIEQQYKRGGPKLVWVLLDLLKDAPRHQPIKHPHEDEDDYATTSEAEQAIIMMLIFCGWVFQEILDFFLRHQTPHFASRDYQADYIRTCIANAKREIVETPSRRTIAIMYINHRLTPWPMRSRVAAEVMEAMLIIAYGDGHLAPMAPRERLIELTGRSYGGIDRALRLLIKEGYIKRLPQKEDEEASRFLILRGRFVHQKIQGPCFSFSSLRRDLHLDRTLSLEQLLIHDLLLSRDEGLSASEVGEWVELDRRTVKNHLEALAERRLVERVGRSAWIGRLPEEAAPTPPQEEPEKAPQPPAEPMPAHDVERHAVTGLPPEKLAVLAALKEAGKTLLKDLNTCEHTHEVPLEHVYARVMAATFKRPFSPDWLDVWEVRRLADLPLALRLMEADGLIPTHCVACYLEWVGRVAHRWVEEGTWKWAVPVSVVASAGVLRIYARYAIEKAELAERLLTEDLFVSRPRKGPDGAVIMDYVGAYWMQVKYPDGRVELVCHSPEALGDADQVLLELPGESIRHDPPDSSEPVDPRQSSDPVVGAVDDHWEVRQAATGQQYFELAAPLLE